MQIEPNLNPPIKGNTQKEGPELSPEKLFEGSGLNPKQSSNTSHFSKKGISDDGADLSPEDPQHRPDLSLRHSPQKRPRVSLYNSQFRSGVTQGQCILQRPCMSQVYDKLRPELSLNYSKQNGPGMSLCDSQLRPGLSLHDTQYRPGLSLRDRIKERKFLTQNLRKDPKEGLKCTESAGASKYQNSVPILKDFNANHKLVNVDLNNNSTLKVDLKNSTSKIDVENSMFQNLEAFEKSISIENSDLVNNQRIKLSQES